MKKTIIIKEHNKKVEREVNYIPFRYIVSILLSLFETLAVIAIVIIISIYFNYFYIAVLITQLSVAIAIINHNDNPEYKLPWLFFVLLIPVVGFMLYFLFYSRKLTKKQVKKTKELLEQKIDKQDHNLLSKIKQEDEIIASQAQMIKKLADSHIYTNTDITYYPLGEIMFDAMIIDLKKAKKFIFMEYFIIEFGLFWDTILEILKEKVKNNVEVRIIYDDIGCMMTLPGNYYKQLNKIGIKTVPFSRLRGQANNEFNNRSHRKITIIDGKVGYTGGINIADEYINHIQKHGHWKDVGVRLEGESVNELTRLFLIDYGFNNKKNKDVFKDYYSYLEYKNEGYLIPFGDGPKPIYERHVSKSIILNMLNQAKRYVYITTPYLIIDNELIEALENASIRGLDIRIITPHIPDKKIIFLMTRSLYARLIKVGVKIYEYEKGFIHAKTYISDDKTAMVGTVNMDYRSLVHHFENGIWIYKHKVIENMKTDFIETQEKSIQINNNMIKENLFIRFIRAIVRIFSPLL